MRRLVTILLLCFSVNAYGDDWDWVPFAMEYMEKHPIVNHEEKTCLAHNIYFEARNESYEGRLAVATVTTNRVNSKHYPNTYCEVVWEQRTNPRTGKKVPQFSWTLDGRPDRPYNLRVYKEAEEIAEEVLRYGKRSAIIGEDVLNYHAHYVQPFWSKRMVLVAQIDTHLFYTN